MNGIVHDLIISSLELEREKSSLSFPRRVKFYKNGTEVLKNSSNFSGVWVFGTLVRFSYHFVSSRHFHISISTKNKRIRFINWQNFEQFVRSV